MWRAGKNNNPTSTTTMTPFKYLGETDNINVQNRAASNTMKGITNNKWRIPPYKFDFW